MTCQFYAGFDPGRRNCGGAIIREYKGKISFVSSRNFDSTKYANLGMFLDLGIHSFISDAIDSGVQAFFKDGEDNCDEDWELNSFTIERYVTYGQVITAETESICGIIGAFRYFFESVQSDSFQNASPNMLRAIDWKIPLCQYLVKNKGFDNPSTSLDKKFSMAAAKACLDNVENIVIKTDHEADAICLAYTGYLIKTNKIKVKA